MGFPINFQPHSKTLWRFVSKSRKCISSKKPSRSLSCFTTVTSSLFVPKRFLFLHFPHSIPPPPFTSHTQHSRRPYYGRCEYNNLRAFLSTFSRFGLPE